MRQVCVFGLGQFGSHLCRKLSRLGCEVLVVDLNEQRVEEIRDHVHRALIGDARNPQLIASVVTDRVDSAVVALGETTIEPSILCVLNLKRIGVTNIVSTARNDDHAAILRAVGAREIIFPERETAERAARRIASPDLLDMFPLEGDYRIMELIAPKRLHGKTLREVEMRKQFDLLVLAVRERAGEPLRFLPSPDTVIQPGEVLLMLGRELDLARFAGL